MASEIVTDHLVHLWIGSGVELDYERRGVFPGLRSGKSHYVAKHGSTHKVPRGTVKAVLEDALEQRKVKRPRSERGLLVSYGVMSKNLSRDLGINLVVRGEFQSVLNSDQAPRDDASVRALFDRLGIPAAEDSEQ